MFARTQRLTLRPGWPEDAPALAAAIAHESVVTRLSRVPWPYTHADAQQFLGLAWQTPGPRFLIVDPANGDQPIGCIGIHDEFAVPEFGYWLTPNAWGRGYATEAGHAVLAIARDGLRLPKLRATWFVGNTASGRVLAKLGFRPTSRIVKQFSIALGCDVDAVETELIWADLPNAQAA